VRPPTALTADQRGTAVVGTTVGVLIFIAFLLLATQVLLGLYTTTVVTATAVDAATQVARGGTPTDLAAQQRAADEALRRLGSFARRPNGVALDWSATTTDEVVLTVHARKMTLLPPALGSALGNRIDRTVRVRAERLR
jgi:hypothetical protein